MMFLAIGVVALLQNPVDHPEYKGWASFKEGSSVTFTMVVDGKAQEGTMKVTLKSVGEKSVVVDEARNIKAMGPDRQAPREIPATVAPGSIPKPEKEGDEEIQAAGKTLKCHWSEIRKSTAGGRIETVRYWVHDDVPGKMVQMRVTQPEGLTATLTAAEWEKK